MQRQAYTAVEMLVTLEKIRGDESKLPELMMCVFFFCFFQLSREKSETLYAFAGRLFEVYDKLEMIRPKQGKTAFEDDMLRSQFISKMGNRIVQKLLKKGY